VHRNRGKFAVCEKAACRPVYQNLSKDFVVRVAGVFGSQTEEVYWHPFYVYMLSYFTATCCCKFCVLLYEFNKGISLKLSYLSCLFLQGALPRIIVPNMKNLSTVQLFSTAGF
jgi:hypothetical protein